MIGASIGALIQNYMDGLIVLNEDYTVNWHNIPISFPQKLSEGKHISELFPCEHVRFEEGETFPVMISGKKYNVEVKIFQSDKSYFVLCFEDLANLQTNIKNRLYCLEKIVESLKEGVMMSNSDGEIILYNLAQEKMEGLNRHEVIGKPLWSAYHYNNPQNSEHKHVFKTKKPIFSRYRAHSKIDGIPRYVNYSTYPIQKDGETIAVFSISTNESQLKDMLYETIEKKRQKARSDEKKSHSSNGTTFTFEDIKGRSLALKSLIKDAQNIALHNTDVLIIGETGTGKELFAQSIHNHSPRSKSPFVAVNCAAIPETLLESTLFGTVKGAYTGANDQAGLFEFAEDGTLFLDEINSMPITLQSKLMRVLQERLVRKVGSNEIIPVRCSVISASNEDPERLIAEGKMRLDLFYRIAHTSLYIPPLRERPEDIQFFIEYFLKRFQNKFMKTVPKLSESLYTKLLHYHWPGNTRELEHLIENLIIKAGETDPFIDESHLPYYMRRKICSVETSEKEAYTKSRTPVKSLFSASKKHYILTTLEQSDWNISAAARSLGISRQSLQYHIKKYNIDKPNNQNSRPQ